MKVLKFGGTSVGSVKSILSLKRIVENEAKKQSVVVVVSALGGITDKLLQTSQLALKGDEQWRVEFDAMVDRHHKMIDTIITDTTDRENLFKAVDALFEQLKSIYFGVYLIHDLSEKTQDAIVSYGERLSSKIVATLIRGAKWFDSRKFIKTERINGKGKHTLDSELTCKLVKETFAELPRISLVPGFISRDKNTERTTNLGRGGSDYTAAIIAAALDAEVLEIWTDVDGFMTADPRVIKSAYTINELNKIDADQKPIKGISSINGTALITVTGLSMVGVIGVNRRIFTALANEGISVFMVSQASSENSTSIGVREQDVEEAVSVLNNEFKNEIADGAMFPMHAECGLATIAIVGENMKHAAGIAGKLFGTLGRSGISVIACAQGASETNISFVVKSDYLRKSLNVLHDSFFLSEYKVLNLFICGVGTVGGKLIEQIKNQYADLMERSKLKLNVVGIASSKNAIFNREGLNLESYQEELKQSAPSSPELLRDTILAMNIFNSVFVDCTASKDVASLYQSLLEHNVSVIAANKIAASSEYENYEKLKKTAIQRGVVFRFETNVGAGLPIIGTINDLRNSGDKILKIEAVLSGTLNFIFNAISSVVPFSETVKLAKEKGYSEPDPRIDLSGMDVIRKLVILSREAGYRVEQEDVEKNLFVPDEFFKGSLDEFWKKLPKLDADFEAKRKTLDLEHKRWRFVATLDGGKTSVGLQAVGPEHPFYNLEGSNNIVLLTTERYKEYPMMIQGYGAGASVTAAGVFANIMSIANV